VYGIGLSISNQRLWRKVFLNSDNTPTIPSQKASEIKIAFSPTASSSFYQADSIEMNNDLIYYELYRVSIQNKSAMANIRVTLEFIEPYPPQLRGKFPLALHLQHDITDAQKTFNLGANDEK